MTFTQNVKKRGDCPSSLLIEEFRGVRRTHEANCVTVGGLETAGIRLHMEATDAVVTILSLQGMACREGMDVCVLGGGVLEQPWKVEQPWKNKRLAVEIVVN